MLMLSRFLARQGHAFRLARGATLRWEDLKSDNIIFLTSFRFEGLANEIGHPLRFVFTPSGLVSYIVDTAPDSGRPKRYFSRMTDPQNGRTYALVSRLPGMAPGRKILILSGIDTWGTAAAAEYVVSPEHLLVLKEALEAEARRLGQSEPEYFQVVLQLDARDGTPVNLTPVAHAVLNSLPPERQGSAAPEAPIQVDPESQR